VRDEVLNGLICNTGGPKFRIGFERYTKKLDSVMEMVERIKVKLSL
jgi:hypothetical protein